MSLGLIQGNPIAASSVEGTDDVSFKVMVTDWYQPRCQCRNLTVSVGVSGTYDAYDGPTTLILGSMATVDIEDDALDSNPATTGSRMIVGNMEPTSSGRITNIHYYASSDGALQSM